MVTSPPETDLQRTLCAGVTTGSRRQKERGEIIRYCTVASPLDRMLIAATDKGICSVAFADTEAALAWDLRKRFETAELQENKIALATRAAAMLACLTGCSAGTHLLLDVRATAFQERVWTALQAIPRGETRTYAQLAASIGQPTATRAVAAACASNPVAVVIPCHRVVGRHGDLTGYRWGVERKRKLLKMELNGGAGDF